MVVLYIFCVSRDLIYFYVFLFLSLIFVLFSQHKKFCNRVYYIRFISQSVLALYGEMKRGSLLIIWCPIENLNLLVIDFTSLKKVFDEEKKRRKVFLSLNVIVIYCNFLHFQSFIMNLNCMICSKNHI